MSYDIFEVAADQKGKINTLTKDDLVSRQSILTRDAHALDIDSDVTFVKIEGSDKGLKRAEELGLTKEDIKQAVREADTKIEGSRGYILERYKEKQKATGKYYPYDNMERGDAFRRLKEATNANLRAKGYKEIA